MEHAHESEDDIDIEGIDLNLDPDLLAILEKYGGFDDAAIVPMASAHSAPQQVNEGEGFEPNFVCGPPQPRQRKKAWSQRRKEEIDLLRAEVIELSTILAQQKSMVRLKSTETRGTTTQLTMASLQQCTTPKIMRPFSWKEVTILESGRRQESEKENAKLCLAVRYYLLQANAIRHAVTSKKPVPLDSRNFFSLINKGASFHNKGVSSELIKELNDVYADI